MYINDFVSLRFLVLERTLLIGMFNSRESSLYSHSVKYVNIGIYFVVFQDGRNSSQDTKFARTINCEQKSDLALLRFPLSFS